MSKSLSTSQPPARPYVCRVRLVEKLLQLWSIQFPIVLWNIPDIPILCHPILHTNCNHCKITLTQQVHNIYQVPPMVTVQSRTFGTFGHTPKCAFPIPNIIISFISSFYYLCLRSSLHRLTTSSAYSARVSHRYHGTQRPGHFTKPHSSAFLAILSNVLYHSAKCQRSHKTALSHWLIQINVLICLAILVPASVLTSVERG